MLTQRSKSITLHHFPIRPAFFACLVTTTYGDHHQEVRDRSDNLPVWTRDRVWFESFNTSPSMELFFVILQPCGIQTKYRLACLESPDFEDRPHVSAMRYLFDSQTFLIVFTSCKLFLTIIPKFEETLSRFLNCLLVCLVQLDFVALPLSSEGSFQAPSSAFPSPIRLQLLHS